MDNRLFPRGKSKSKAKKKIKCKYDACFNVLALSCKRGEEIEGKSDVYRSKWIKEREYYYHGIKDI